MGIADKWLEKECTSRGLVPLSTERELLRFLKALERDNDSLLRDLNFYKQTVERKQNSINNLKLLVAHFEHDNEALAAELNQCNKEAQQLAGEVVKLKDQLNLLGGDE